MKSILISSHLKEVVKILKGKEKIIIRRTAPKAWIDYLSSKSFRKPMPINVYIYCTKNGAVIEKDCGLGFPEPINGKVVAKFSLKSVAQYINGKNVGKNLKTDYITDGVLDGADMSIADLQKYGNGKYGESFFAWHISDLEIFNTPYLLSEFGYYSIYDEFIPVIKPPQSWQYVGE